MNMLGWTPRGRQLQALMDQNHELVATVKMQALVINDVTSATNLDTKYKGNAYQSYADAVDELSAKYSGTADWGVLQTGNIVDLRAAFIAGGGLTPFPKDKRHPEGAKNEMDFVSSFFEANNLDREAVQDFAKEAEIEGRFLGELFWDDDKEQVVVRYRAWSDLNYTVKTAAGDYAKYEKVIWTKDSSEQSLDAPNFVYGRFGGRLGKNDDPYPKVAKCLTQIDDLDKALKDWREICRLFAAPVPHIECATAKEAQEMQEAVNKLNYKIKKFLCHTGSFSYASPSMAGAQSLMEEIITLAKMISGTTGVPVQFLGLPDIASVRSSESTNTAELVSAATQKERLIWKGIYQEMIRKAMAIWNEKSGLTTLDPALVTVDIPYITADHWARIRDIWLPLYTGSAISQETLLEQVPGINMMAELKAKGEREAKMLADFNRDAAEDDDSDEDDEDEAPPPARGRGRAQRTER
jgi:hypothetical protein